MSGKRTSSKLGEEKRLLREKVLLVSTSSPGFAEASFQRFSPRWKSVSSPAATKPLKRRAVGEVVVLESGLGEPSRKPVDEPEPLFPLPN